MSGAVVRAVGAFAPAGADPGLFVFDKAPHCQKDREQHDSQHDDRDPIGLQKLKHTNLSFFIYSCAAQNRVSRDAPENPRRGFPAPQQSTGLLRRPSCAFGILRVSPLESASL